MAKKTAKTDRQKVIDDLRKKQKSSERRRGFMIVGVCGAIALLIVVAAAWKPVKDWWDLRQFEDIQLAEIGAAASVCQDIVTEPAEGNNEHVPTGQQVTYSVTPPAFGAHWNEAGVAPAPMERKFYTAEDRPELESLVHNSEHGYTILWYDEVAAEDEETMETIEAIADKFQGTENFRMKFIAAPWTAEDAAEHGPPPAGATGEGDSGEAQDGQDQSGQDGQGQDDQAGESTGDGSFPDDQHIALTHWSVSGDVQNGEQLGIWQFCSEPSGAALESFMEEYPYMDSPEPGAM